MITKESAMHIYNLHSQIEKSNEMISKLKEVKDNAEKDTLGVDIIKDGWGSFRTIEIAIPERFYNPGSTSMSGARIYQISVADAILVLENHVVRLNKALEDANKIAVTE